MSTAPPTAPAHTIPATPPTPQEIDAAYRVLRRQPPWRHAQSAHVHQRVLPLATHAPWLTDTAFQQLYERVRGHTLVDLYRCHELWTLAQQVHDIEGDILEVGVWRGGTGAILAQAVRDLPGKKVYLADTFSGVVKAGANDTRYKGGEHADTSLELVGALMAALHLDNTELLQGIFPDDTQARVRGRIAMLHCDVDVYASSRDIVEWCLPRMAPGAVLVFDDYGFYGCEGVTRYCDELRAHPGLRFIHNLNGHAVFIKFS